ncbi:MAG: hypothetical protein KZQ94_10090 [Candidatus Thiodiazotropha sp. (ex Troendleina suluensis)]|nr:hypothetical protein [Candidatus Thiodiazotropha sp. (ex Troendleina suluensis)]
MRKYQFLLLLVILVSSQGSLSQSNPQSFHGIVHGAENLQHILNSRSLLGTLAGRFRQFFFGKTAVIGRTIDLATYRPMMAPDEVILMDVLSIDSGIPATNLSMNMSALRSAIRNGSGRIRDVSPINLNLINNANHPQSSRWLAAERSLLRDRGWLPDGGIIENGRIIYTWGKHH